jgi:hypothetical protein
MEGWRDGGMERWREQRRARTHLPHTCNTIVRRRRRAISHRHARWILVAASCAVLEYGNSSAAASRDMDSVDAPPPSRVTTAPCTSSRELEESPRSPDRYRRDVDAPSAAPLAPKSSFDSDGSKYFGPTVAIAARNCNAGKRAARRDPPALVNASRTASTNTPSAPCYSTLYCPARPPKWT